MWKKYATAKLVLWICIAGLVVLLGQNAKAENALIVNERGNVGIGTNEPVKKLEVNGTIRAHTFEGRGSTFGAHQRVLWDKGWIDQPTGAQAYGKLPNKELKLTYGNSRTLFYRPLSGYGIPEPVDGATQKVKLYVTYSHQMDCKGIPVIKISSGNKVVEFTLPRIGGTTGDIGANWSSVSTYNEYKDIGHSEIFMYSKDGTCDVAGHVYRIEAHFYNEYN